MALKAWMRILRITLTTKNISENGKVKQIVFEENKDNVGLALRISGNKFMSTLKDNCTIEISNLTYVELIKIITGEFYNVKVECGYKSTGVQTIFDGGVMYVSHFKDSYETHKVTLLCASHLVASYGQKRINLSFNSGINLYSAINFVSKVGGIPNPNISTQFKKKFYDEIEIAENTNAAEWIAGQANKNGAFITNSDCVGNSFMTMFDASKSNSRIIKINEQNLIMTNGFPKMTTDGLTFTMMPTFAFQCGDTIVMNNEIIQIGARSQSEAMKNLGGLLDKNGQYLIFEISYVLENRGSSFYMDILAKTRSRISAYLGKEMS